MRGIMIMAMLLTACSNKEAGPGPKKRDFSGDQAAAGVVMIQTEGGRKLWKLVADSMEQKGDTVRALGVKISFYNRRGATESVLTSDSGRYYQASGDMTAVGHVEVEGEDGSHLSTASLSYSKERNEIFTPDRVYIRTQDKEIWGVGLVSDPGLRRIRIEKQVSGKGQDEEWAK